PFFFQAEDGIRDFHVTGVQTCALPILAAGRTDGFWEFGLRAWDTAAGTLLIREAGGLIATLDGDEYRQNGNIVAGTPRVFNELLDRKSVVQGKRGDRRGARARHANCAR